jgi:predicted RND superfamily exporter protein
MATCKDMTDMSVTDLVRVDLMGLIMVGFILAVMLTSVSIPFILMAGIQLAIFLNLTITYVNGNFIPYITLASLSSIQLGSCVNYAIFLIARYREERQTLFPNEAMQKSLLGTAPAIFGSGLCLFCSTIGMVFISDIEMFKSLALLIGRGALISVAIVLILLPGVIIVCDKLILSTSLGWKKVIKE